MKYNTVTIETNYGFGVGLLSLLLLLLNVLLQQRTKSNTLTQMNTLYICFLLCLVSLITF